MAYLLPATVYQPPSRLGRGRQLNTIVEDNEETIHGFTSESEGTASDRTIIARPAALEAKHLARSLQRNKPTYLSRPPSVVSSEADEDCEMPQESSRSSYAESDAGTVFSESCPSLTGSHASDRTSFVTDSARSSLASRNSRNRYPALLIPLGSWQASPGDAKALAFGMSPSTKVKLSPELLSRLPRHISAPEAPPSFGDSSSIRSESPCLRPMSSAPATPDLQNIEIIEGQPWDGQERQMTLDTPLEIAIDEEHSILLSPAEAHSSAHTTSRVNSNYDEIMRQFPLIPGATPIEHTPVTPGASRSKAFVALTGEPGVQLPAMALAMLQSLDQQRYAASVADSSVCEQQEEMKECPVPRKRPQSWAQKSPGSEYSISQLSIPSPGGFFSSLKAGARSTWCSPAPSRRMSPPPSSTTAENFYNTPWNQPSVVKETILEYGDENGTDGPPTVKQAMFDLGIRAVVEDDDMYGGGVAQVPKTSHEYEESYEDGLKMAAEVNIDRTSNWLAAQTTYLSALRETNPLNDPADFPATPSMPSEAFDQAENTELESNKAAKFLEAAKAATSAEAEADAPIKTPISPPKETMFLQAFTYQKSETKRSDVFLHASSRLDSVQTTRIATPKRHLQTLLNTHTSKTLEPEHARPKYRGPFSQDPKRNPDLAADADPAEYNRLERQQSALHAIKPNIWSLEAQRTILYNGRLMANRAASERITRKDSECAIDEQPVEESKPNKKRPKILDLAGAATASWAWAAATKWPNAKVFTVQTKQQAELARNAAGAKADDVESYRPETPKNHKVISVPHLWQLPFGDNHFDVISARTLHMYLRANPVPGVDSIDEWDMTLKECMRVLKPGGILDFFVMDSGISNGGFSAAPVDLSPIHMKGMNANLSSTVYEPKRKNITAEFRNQLERRGYETDGGCGRLMGRLKQEGFVGVRRQWIGLPMGCAETEAQLPRSRTHHRGTSNSSATSHWINQQHHDTGKRRPAFLPAPRPISEVSDIAKIVDQYCDVEAVHGPVGSTIDVSDMSALLGELLWEEWLVRLRIESGEYSPETLLDGIDEQFSEWRRSGKAAWRGVLGWARKPSKKEIHAVRVASCTNGLDIDIEGHAASSKPSSIHFTHAFNIETPLPTPATLPPDVYVSSRSTLVPSVNLSRKASVRASRHFGAPSSTTSSASSGLTVCTSISTRRSGNGDWSHKANEVSLEEFTFSALDRGEVGEIPMLIMG